MNQFLPFFALDKNFLDPQISKDGKPYGPQRFKEIVRECWYISDKLHTSYTDVLDISVQERVYLIQNIEAKEDATKKAWEEAAIKAQNKK